MRRGAPRVSLEGYLPRSFFKPTHLLHAPINIHQELDRAATNAIKQLNTLHVEQIMTHIIRSQHTQHELALYKCFQLISKPNHTHFNMLIEFHSNVAQNLDNALLVLENACKLGMAQNMLQACAVLVRRCHPDSAGPAYTKHIKQIIQIMEFYDITPNQDILATAIDALVKEGLVQDAITIFNDLEEVYKIKPNVNMYGSIIQAFSNANDLENAVTIYWKMLAKNITPNSRTILKLITAVSRKAADAHSSGNLNPNVKGITLSEIIDQLCEGLVIAEDIDEEFELKSITTILSALSRSSNLDVLRKCISLYEQTKFIQESKIDPPQLAIIANQVLRAIVTLRNSNIDEEEKQQLDLRAKKVFDLIRARNIIVDEMCVYFFGRLFLGWNEKSGIHNVVYQAFTTFREFEVNMKYYEIDVIARSIAECYQQDPALPGDMLLNLLIANSKVPVFE